MRCQHPKSAPACAGASESLDVQLAAASLQIFTRADDGQMSKLTVSSQLVIERQSTRSNLFRRRTDLISTRHSLQVTRLAARTPTRTGCTLAVEQVMMATLRVELGRALSPAARRHNRTHDRDPLQAALTPPLLNTGSGSAASTIRMTSRSGSWPCAHRQHALALQLRWGGRTGGRVGSGCHG